MENCSCVAADMAKIFEVYWYLGLPHTPIPPVWPAEYDTAFNKETPMKVLLNATESSLYLSVSLSSSSSRSSVDPSVHSAWSAALGELADVLSLVIIINIIFKVA